MGQMAFTIQDHSTELSTVVFPVAEPATDGSNYQSIAVTQFAALLVAVQALTKGNVLRRSMNVRQLNENSDVPTDPYAQREIGARFYYRTTGPLAKTGHFTIPAADLDLIVTNNSDEIDLSITEVGALITLVEALMEVDGESVEVYRGRVVGRNN